jgi:SAM-dependent methyltransferase
MALYYLDRFCRGIVGEYVGVDMNIERLRERWRFVNLPYAFQPVNLDDQWDFGTFDVVWCSEVIEHLLDDERLFRRLGAQLGPSGVLVITTPSLPFIERMGRLVPGFDHISPTQDGGHVRMGYELRNFERMAQRDVLRVESHAWLSPCSTADLRTRLKPSAMNSLRRTLRDLIRSNELSVVSGDRSAHADAYYTLAVTFAKGRDSCEMENSPWRSIEGVRAPRG